MDLAGNPRKPRMDMEIEKFGRKFVTSFRSPNPNRTIHMKFAVHCSPSPGSAFAEMQKWRKVAGRCSRARRPRTSSSASSSCWAPLQSRRGSESQSCPSGTYVGFNDQSPLVLPPPPPTFVYHQTPPWVWFVEDSLFCASVDALSRSVRICVWCDQATFET